MDSRSDDARRRGASTLAAVRADARYSFLLSPRLGRTRAVDTQGEAARTKASTPPAGRPHLDSIGLAVFSAEAGGDPLEEPFPSLPRRTGGSEPSQQDGARTGKKEKQGGMN